MPDFWEDNAGKWWASAAPKKQAPAPKKQAPAPKPDPPGLNDTAGVCAFCGYADDDVLLGVCADCAPED